MARESDRAGVPGRRFLGGWIPEQSRSTIALVWEVSEGGKPSFTADIMRAGHKIGVLNSADLADLARQLADRCGAARKSMVRLCVAALSGGDAGTGHTSRSGATL